MQQDAHSMMNLLEPRRLFAIDLITQAVQVDSYDPANGLLTYEAFIANTGSTTPPKTLGAGNMVLSKDQVINNSDDIRLDLIDSQLTPRFSQLDLVRTVRIPGSVAPGDYYVGVALDIDNQLEELSDANNFMFTNTTIHVPKLLDLTFNGTEANDDIEVGVDALGKVQIQVNNDRYSYDRARINSLQIYGLAGNDVINLNPGLTLPVYLNGGDGNDLLRGGLGNDVLTGAAGKDDLFGGGGNDRLNGNGGNDRLYGETGPDRLYGGAGRDLLDGGSSGDHLDGGDGIDTVYGQGGNDTITSTDGQIDLLFGGTGKDVATADPNDVLASVTFLPPAS
jgi:hypothetical protein